MTFIDQLKQRKVLQWAIAYGAGAWAAVQVIQFLSDAYGWPAAVLRVVPVLLVAGWIAVLVLAWFHGDRGRQRATFTEVALLVLVLVVGGGLAAMVGSRGGGEEAVVASARVPLVMMMDSPHPDRVYDAETVTANGTNADVLSDVLLDLPIRRQKEAVGPGWHRDEEIRQFDPDLVLIHFSAFCASACNTWLSGDSVGAEARNRLKVFMRYFADASTQFLIYSRGPDLECAASRACEERLRKHVDALLSDVYAQHPGFRERVHVFGVRDYGPPHFRNAITANSLKLRVRSILGFR